MIEFKDQKDLNQCCLHNFNKIIVIVFYADWQEHSKTYLNNLQKLIKLQGYQQDIIFAFCDAEKVEKITKEFNVNYVPTVLFITSIKKVLEKHENIVPAIVFDKLEICKQIFKQNFQQTQNIMFQKIEKLLKENAVIVFIKGTAQKPFCQYSVQMVELLKSLEINYAYYDIKTDDDMRNWLRHYSKWPTYPQLFIKGELIGGLDKSRELIKDGSLQNKLPPDCHISQPNLRLKYILQDNPVILFLDGLPQMTTNDRTKQTVESLKKSGVRFNCFNLLIDIQLSEYIQNEYKLKLPILFTKGNCIGSLEEITQLIQQESILNYIPGSEWRLNSKQQIMQLLKICPIICFINGTNKDPNTEDSKNILKILNENNIKFDYYNVNSEEDIQYHLENIFNITKIPALFVNGKLIGDMNKLPTLIEKGKLKDLLLNNCSQ